MLSIESFRLSEDSIEALLLLVVDGDVVADNAVEEKSGDANGSLPAVESAEEDSARIETSSQAAVRKPAVCRDL